MKLYTLPFAGGSSYSYSALNHHFDSNILVEHLEPPGRGKRFDETLLTDLNHMARDVSSRIDLSQPYLIYGHSMGAMLTYLVAKQLQDAKQPLPEAIFVSGSEPPDQVSQNNQSSAKSYLLNTADFFEHVKSFGGISEEVFQNEEIQQLYEPILRADMQAIEDYVYQRASEKLSVPIYVFAGDEEVFTAADIAAWRDLSSENCELSLVPGDHFFIYHNFTPIAEAINQFALTTAL